MSFILYTIYTIVHIIAQFKGGIIGELDVISIYLIATH